MTHHLGTKAAALMRDDLTGMATAGLFGAALWLMGAGLVLGQGQKVITAHGISTFGELKYPADFKHLDYVNPDAPKGGELKLSETGTYDTFNPILSKGEPATAVTTLVFDTLLK